MRHKAVEGLDAGVFDGVEFAAKPERHFDPRIGSGPVSDIPELDVAAGGTAARFKILNTPLQVSCSWKASIGGTG